MRLVHLLPVGNVDPGLLQTLKREITQRLDVSCDILPVPLDPLPSFHEERQQYYSSGILQQMQSHIRSQTWRLLGVADVDLYIPILKYVFGEAQLDGRCALVSIHRLREEFYGLQSNDELLAARLVKEAIHELGHTLNLRHCGDYGCVMASAHAVEWVDLRGSAFCEACRAELSSLSDCTPMRRPTRSLH
jgi:archaemetzincin